MTAPRFLALFALLGSFFSATPGAAEPRFAANVPPSITTPDSVRTVLIGDLPSLNGTPRWQTVQKANDFIEVSRGAEAFLNGIPAASVYALLAVATARSNSTRV